VPSRPLSRDRALEVRLHSRAGICAGDVARDRTSRAAAVAVLALTAPCRPDVVATVRRRIASVPSREVEWPPRTVQIQLLTSSERVTQGFVRLAGPAGVTVEQVTYTDKLGHTLRVLRLRRHGVVVGDFRTVEELGRQVDLGTLSEEDHDGGS
jgi:hypothetical protein